MRWYLDHLPDNRWWYFPSVHHGSPSRRGGLDIWFHPKIISLGIGLGWRRAYAQPNLTLRLLWVDVMVWRTFK